MRCPTWASLSLFWAVLNEADSLKFMSSKNHNVHILSQCFIFFSFLAMINSLSVFSTWNPKKHPEFHIPRIKCCKIITTSITPEPDSPMKKAMNDVMAYPDEEILCSRIRRGNRGHKIRFIYVLTKYVFYNFSSHLQQVQVVHEWSNPRKRKQIGSREWILFRPTQIPGKLSNIGWPYRRKS